MIQKLQRRFILITMCCLSLTVLILVVMIDVLSYLQVSSQYDEILQVLVENDGVFPKGKKKSHPEDDVREYMNTPLDDEIKEHMNTPLEDIQEDFQLQLFSFRLSEETPYEVRYFTVRAADHGDTVTNLTHIASVSEEEALNFVNKIEKSKKDSGYISHYCYRVSEDQDESLYIFVDCQNGIRTVKAYFLMSFSAGIFLIILVLVPVIILSRRAMKPVADSIYRQKQFITDAGHELKTPLSIISANVEVLELCSEENQWTDSIKNQVQRMNSLVSNLLMLARLDEMQEEEETQKFRFGEVLQNTAESFSVVAAGKQITMETFIDTSAVVMGSPSRLSQLILILLDNAVKYTAQGGNIRIRCKKTDKQVILSVWNTCDPLSEQEISRLFDRFYRNDPSRSRLTGGYGIGLSAAQAITKAHRGSISAKNQGEGICFIVQLPRIRS